MSFHHDPVVDKAMRAVIGAGGHFWDPDTSRLFRSKPVSGILSGDGKTAYVIERYRTQYMGGVCVQTPHSRVVIVNLETGKTDSDDEYSGTRYLGPRKHKTNAQAMKRARELAEASTTVTPETGVSR